MSSSKKKKMVKVRATRLGYDGKYGRIKPGTVFMLEDESLFSSKWMERVSDEEKAKEPKPEKLEAKAEAFSSMVSGDADVI